MRNVIDFDVEQDAVSVFCEIADTSCMESCINFIAEAETLTVHFNRGGAGYETVIPVVDGSACYMLPDAQMRAAGEFTICAAGKTKMRFVVEQTIAPGTEYSVRLTNGVFYVKCQSANKEDDWIRPKITLERLANGVLITVEDADGVQTAMVYDGVGGDPGNGEFNCSFYINADGDLICTYVGQTAPRFSINADGCLIYTYDDGSEAPILSINADGCLIYTTEA